MRTSKHDANAAKLGAGELSGKGIEQSNGLVPEFLDDIHDWLFGHRPKILEHYLNNRFSCHFYVRLRFAEMDSLDFCAFLSRPLRLPRRVEANNPYRVILGSRSRIVSDSQFEDVCQGGHDGQEAMFVGVIHFAE